MKITLNGKPRDVEPGTTVAMLVERVSEETARDPRGVAIERNGEIVPKSEHVMTALGDGDVIEFVTFVGGG